MFVDEDPAAFNGRIEALTRALDASTDVEARTCARELVRLVLEFHGLGLQRILGIVAGAPAALRQQLARDPVVAGLLALHELETVDRIGEAGHEAKTAHAPLIQISRRPATLRSSITPPHAERGLRCQRCGAPLDEAHRHHVDIASRQLSCSCRACWLLSEAHVDRGSLRAVPDRYLTGPAFRLSDSQWDALQVPVSTAFFMFNTTIGRTIAFYPSPAGATESTLSLSAWHEVEWSNPWVGGATPDVEAVLVRRNPGTGATGDAFIVPIDACYDLVGRIRLHWAGFDGGDAVRTEIDRFFADVTARSARAETVVHQP